MTDLKFADAPVPQVTADKGPNPFKELFGKDGLGDKAKTVTLNVSPEHPKGEKYKNDKIKPHPEVARLTSQARDAAADIGLTARVKVEVASGSTKSNPKTTFTVWTTKRITRARSEETPAAEGDATEGDAPEGDAPEGDAKGE